MLCNYYAYQARVMDILNSYPKPKQTESHYRETRAYLTPPEIDDSDRYSIVMERRNGRREWKIR